MIFTFKYSNTLYKTLAILLCIGFSKTLYGQSVIQPGMNDLTFFKKSSKTWQIVGSVQADLNKANTLYFTKGTGVLLNLPNSKQKGEDLYSLMDFGDIDLELEYLMASESNSGIYLQGRYEIQLIDTWGATAIRSGSNGGIYERWDDSKPDGQKGYMGYAPRQNASRAPGLWQKLKISFQAPRFDSNGKKTANAVMLKVELNGVIIHDHVELSGPTRGAIADGETASGPLRIQGDHGAVAFRNIKISRFENARPAEAVQANGNSVDPIHIEPSENYILRSFMDLPGSPRVVHAVSVGSPEKVHYTYDMDNSAIIQVWRGGFLNATPMWHDRGDGSSRPLGMVQRFGKPAQSLSKLSNRQSAWISDTAGTGYRPKGYALDAEGRPTFKYIIYGISVNDAIKLLEKGQGITRQITLSDNPAGLYFRLAEAANITEVSQGLYLIDDQSYFLRLDESGGSKAIIRDQNGRKELIIAAVKSLSYSILF
ncbi:MAG: DUF1080 domain-containing protein [Daejeonella sp.]|uniref:3-keto-disaccharide hydrolase n=1 Tax=Daejeonella sp. TaxID=2805397 RepID=UPI002734CEEB|nr:DUF1080 domain-containing protein [Daejeonella sp.]MDP3469630.1 DUF1080 domain-containing protein [Daejeonella sp.]